MEEEQDIEVIEIDMNGEEVGELIGKLNDLMENKGNAEIELADDLQLNINYIDEEEENDE